MKAKKDTQFLVEYRSNNSGGNWWLSDKDWKALEKSGWLVNWGHKDGDYVNGYYKYDKKTHFPIFKETSRRNGKDKRWLGALATECFKVFPSIKEALEEFEKITKTSISDEGCNCCGAPHTFWWYKVSDLKDGKHVPGEYASGEELLQHLYSNKKIPKSLREAVELLGKE